MAVGLLVDGPRLQVTAGSFVRCWLCVSDDMQQPDMTVFIVGWEVAARRRASHSQKFWRKEAGDPAPLLFSVHVPHEADSHFYSMYCAHTIHVLCTYCSGGRTPAFRDANALADGGTCSTDRYPVRSEVPLIYRGQLSSSQLSSGTSRRPDICLYRRLPRP